ncbi:MAG: methyltransferase domain-containing protein [Pseudolysinimonas sp.]
MERPADRWSSGNDYEGFMGRWSRLVAPEFLARVDVPAGADWLEIGCGTGELSRQILELTTPSRLVAVDPSEGFLDYARAHVLDERVRFEIGTALELPGDEGPFDAIVSGLVLNFVPDRTAALAALHGALAPGGILAAYVWDYAGEMWFLRRFWDAAREIDPANDEGDRFDFCNPRDLRAMFEAAGLDEVETSEIVIPTHFASFDDYWNPFLGGAGPAGALVTSLPDPEREILRDSVRARLPISPDGSIPLTARAWVVTGRAATPVE